MDEGTKKPGTVGTMDTVTMDGAWSMGTRLASFMQNVVLREEQLVGRPFDAQALARAHALQMVLVRTPKEEAHRLIDEAYAQLQPALDRVKALEAAAGGQVCGCGRPGCPGTLTMSPRPAGAVATGPASAAPTNPDPPKAA